MCNIALCVLTHNHPETVEEVLQFSIQDYYNLGIDIYYYDSGSDESTCEVIRKYQDKGFSNLYYIPLETDVVPQTKLELIFAAYGLQKEYDYIWPTKDRSFCSAETLKIVKECAKEAADVIFLGISSDPLLHKTFYDNAVEFYYDCGWLTTSIDVTLYRKSTILADYSAEKYPMPPEDEFAHFSFLYRRILALEHYRIEALCGGGVCIFNSHKSASGWQDRVFEIWKDNWIAANDRLPSVYEKYKGKVIKEAASKPWLLGGIERLCELHKQGLLTPDSIGQIKADWERVSDVPVDVLERIAYGSYDGAHDIKRLPVENNGSLAVVISLAEFVREGKMPKELIPEEDIKTCILTEFQKHPKCSELSRHVLQGTLDDIFEQIKRPETSLEDVGNLLQVLILLQFLM